MTEQPCDNVALDLWSVSAQGGQELRELLG
jgi:hypothetical protein